MSQSQPSDQQYYRQEAARLRTLAETFVFAEVRDSIRALARRYELLAERAATREADASAGDSPSRNFSPQDQGPQYQGLYGVGSAD